MKLLTFLGVANYQTTTYTWGELSYSSRYAPAAASYFLKPETIIVFLTEDAEGQVYPDFKESMPYGLAVQAVPVPLGRDEAELWQIFDRVSQSVQPGEQVAFDITHGLRSFPLVGLLAAAFLRASLDVNIKAILYGAFDVGRVVSPGNTPVFDLSPMLVLLEWAIAADRFNRTGDARYLASLVADQQRSLALAARGDKAMLEEAGALYHLAKALTNISQALRLIRPHQAMEQVAGLAERIEDARPALQRAAAARPFSLVLETVNNAYQPLAHRDVLSSEQLKRTLAVERELVRWYAQREQWVQSVSLAREWLLSWVMVQLGLIDLTNQPTRQRIEQVVGAEAQDFLKAKQSSQPFRSVFLANLPEVEVVLSLWLALGNARNDIDHAGMRLEPGKPENLIAQIQGCLEDIERLPL